MVVARKSKVYLLTEQVIPQPWIACERHVGLMDRVVLVQALAGNIVLCSWWWHFTLTVLLSTLEYKWVLTGGGRGADPVIDLYPIHFMLQKLEISTSLMGGMEWNVSPGLPAPPPSPATHLLIMSPLPTVYQMNTPDWIREFVGGKCFSQPCQVFPSSLS